MEMHVFNASLYDTQYQYFGVVCREGSNVNAQSTVADACEPSSVQRSQIDALEYFTTDGQKRVARKGSEEFNGIKIDISLPALWI